MTHLKDHRQIGRELDLFTISELVGQGLPLFTPKGTIFRNLIEKYIFDLLEKNGYQHVWSPHLAKKGLYEQSGHWEKFQEDMFPPIKTKNREYLLKAMNCPHHIQIFKRKPMSYREIPQRYAETSTVYRSEQSGELGGLTRVLSITIDDAHVFCMASQIKEELTQIIKINQTMLKDFGFDKYRIRLSLHNPEKQDKYLGTLLDWSTMSDIMRTVLNENDIDFEEKMGEAAFYGPKMDLIISDSQNREWQLSTVQLDFNLPERFDLTYIDQGGKKRRVYMIHRATFGSIERFIAVLLEHTQGNLPEFIVPIRVMIIPVADRHVEYAYKIAKEKLYLGERVDIDERKLSVPKRVRDAKIQKIPNILVIGDKEIERGI